MLVFLEVIISRVTSFEETLGRVESTESTTEATLKTIRIRVGTTKKAFDALSNLGIRLDNTTENDDSVYRQQNIGLGVGYGAQFQMIYKLHSKQGFYAAATFLCCGFFLFFL